MQKQLTKRQHVSLTVTIVADLQVMRDTIIRADNV